MCCMCSIAQHSGALVHCMELSVFFFPLLFAELQDAVEEVLPALREQGISVYLMSDSCSIEGITSLSDKISQASDQPLSQDLRANVGIRSTALYIYTSGTTGTPRSPSDKSQQEVNICNHGNNFFFGKCIVDIQVLCLFPTISCQITTNFGSVNIRSLIRL